MPGVEVLHDHQSQARVGRNAVEEGLQRFARDVVVAGLQVGIRVAQHVRDVGAGHGQVARRARRRIAPVPDEIVQVFGHCDRQPARILVQFHLRDQTATTPGIESGRITFQNVCAGVAPRSWEASTRLPGMCSSEA